MARSFVDSEGRQWSVKVTVGVIEKVREIGVDLGDITGTAMRQIANDDVLLVRVLWLICEPQADAAGVSPAQFGESLIGDSLENAYEALRGSLEDFFPPRKRAFWRKMLEADRESQTEAMAISLAALDDPVTKTQITEAMTARVKAEIQRSLTRLKSATDSEASPE